MQAETLQESHGSHSQQLTKGILQSSLTDSGGLTKIGYMHLLRGIALVLFLVAGGAHGEAATEEIDLTDLPLEQLLALERILRQDCGLRACRKLAAHAALVSAGTPAFSHSTTRM